MKKQLFLLFSLSLFLSLTLMAGAVLAQEQPTTSTTTPSDNLTAADLGISDPKILPDSPWYGLKKFWEGIKDSFTFNPIVKAENSLARASERLIEIQKLVDQGKIKDADKIIAQYEKQIDKIKTRIEKLTDIQSDKTEKFLDKFAEYQIKHRLILEKIEESTANPESLKEAKDKALGALSEALSKTDNEKLQARLEKAIAKIEGSDDLKQFKNLEVLKALADKVPEQARPAILKAQANALKRLKEDINGLPKEIRLEKIDKFLEKSRGDSSKYLEILDQLIANDSLSPEVIKKLQEIKLQIQAKIENEAEDDQEEESEINREAKTVPPVRQGEGNKDCLCAEVFQPVCGIDGRTYANICRANCRQVKVISTWPCPETEDDEDEDNNTNQTAI